MGFRKFLTKKVNWPDKLIDLIVVILGISIAFGMDNCSGNQKLDSERKVYLKTLLIDLRKDSVNLVKAKQGIREETALIDTLFRLTDKTSMELSPTIASSFVKIGNIKGNFEAENFAYEGLKESGSLSLLNDSITIKLNRLQDKYQRLESDEEIMREIVLDYAVPVFFNYDSRKKVMVDSSLYFSPKFNNILLAFGGNISQRRRIIDEAIKNLSDAKKYIVETIDE